MKDLKSSNLWDDVFKRHVIETGRVLNYMSGKGVLRDEVKRNEAEVKLAELLADVNRKIESVVPLEARQLKVYKKTPKNPEGMIQTAGLITKRFCPNCHKEDVKADHFKSIGIKKLKAGGIENSCAGYKGEKREVTAILYALPLEFKVSNVSLQRYQKVVNHMPIFDPKKKTITFDEKAIARLIKQYKKDPLYPLILEFREIQKLLGTYVGVTQYDKIEVPDDYVLLIGEKLIEN